MVHTAPRASWRLRYLVPFVTPHYSRHIAASSSLSSFPLTAANIKAFPGSNLDSRAFPFVSDSTSWSARLGSTHGNQLRRLQYLVFVAPPYYCLYYTSPESTIGSGAFSSASTSTSWSIPLQTARQPATTAGLVPFVDSPLLLWYVVPFVASPCRPYHGISVFPEI